MALLTPDRYFSRISAIDIERDLLGCGLSHVLLDIDNTVRARDTGCVPRDVGMWLGRAREAGVSFCLLSNNWHADVYRFAGELELPIVAKALKPLPPAFLAARRKIGGAAADTVVVGDQLATDVLGAHLTGMKAYMLQPLVEQDLPHTLLLRNVEIASRSRRSISRNARRAVPRRAADKEAPLAASGRARSAGSKGPRAKREGNRCEREAVCAGAPGEPFEIAGHVQRRL